MIKSKMIEYYFDLAERTAMLSDATKRKVGAVIVRDDNIISFSWNGTPPNWHSNRCEDDMGMKTLPEVIHAEENAILKLAKHGVSAMNGHLFCTTAPCFSCAKMLVTSGIKTVYYIETYKTNDGLDFLKKCNVELYKRGNLCQM